MHRCIQNSFIASALSVFAFALHRILRTEKRAIKAYLVPVPFALKQLKHAKIPASKIHILPYPVPVGADRGHHREPTEPFVLYAGRLSSEKGVSTLIAAAAHLPDTRFVVAGAGPESEALRAECVIQSITNVEFTGFIPREKLATYIQSARLIVVPSLWYDVSPYAVLEAQAEGKAVLASRIGGIPELIEDGKTGFLFAPGNARILASRIESLVLHSRMLDVVGRAAYERIQKQHDSAAHYEALMKIYEHIVAA
jgi:glycosyltransferase involved in cell wall biosynthesis